MAKVIPVSNGMITDYYLQLQRFLKKAISSFAFFIYLRDLPLNYFFILFSYIDELLFLYYFHYNYELLFAFRHVMFIRAVYLPTCDV